LGSGAEPVWCGRGPGLAAQAQASSPNAAVPSRSACGAGGRSGSLRRRTRPLRAGEAAWRINL